MNHRKIEDESDESSTLLPTGFTAKEDGFVYWFLVAGCFFGVRKGASNRGGKHVEHMFFFDICG